MRLKKILAILTFLIILAINIKTPTTAHAQTFSPYLKGIGFCHWVRNWSVDWAYTSSDPEVWWSTLEPKDNNFNISPLISLIERQTKAIKTTNKQFWIQIYLAGISQTGQKKYPQWLINKGAEYISRGNDGAFVPWNKIFLSELEELLKKINEEFEKKWGPDLENMPKNFGGIVIWSGGYYGEMQIYNAPQRPLWEKAAKKYFASQGKNLKPPTNTFVSPNDPFVKEFNKLWFNSAVNLAKIYAQSFNPKIKLMFQLGNGLYGAYGGGFIEYEGKNMQVDEAAAYEILKQPWGKNRFLFKYNGWQPGINRYVFIFKNLLSYGALGTGYEGGHLNLLQFCESPTPNGGCNKLKKEAAKTLVDLALATPVDYVCIQPSFLPGLQAYPELFKKLADNLGKRTGIKPKVEPSPSTYISPNNIFLLVRNIAKYDFLNRTSFLTISFIYLSLFYFFFSPKKANQAKKMILAFLLAFFLAEAFSFYSPAFILLAFLATF